MESHDQSGTGDFITEFSRQRHRVMRHAQRILASDAPVPVLEQPEAVPQLSALLLASLEELKVAEEQMLEQHDSLSHRAELMDREVGYYRQLFELAPCMLLLTDRNGGIREANHAAAALLKRDPACLDRKPIAALVPRGERQAFRDGLARLALTDGASNWHFSLERLTDVPIAVVAVVAAVPDGGNVPGGFLWAIRPTLPGAGES